MGTLTILPLLSLTRAVSGLVFEVATAPVWAEDEDEEDEGDGLGTVGLRTLILFSGFLTPFTSPSDDDAL